MRISPTQVAGLLFIPSPDQLAAMDQLRSASKAWITGTSWQKNMEVTLAMCWTAALNGETSLICVGSDHRDQMVSILKEAGMQGLYFNLGGHADSAILGAFQVARKKKASVATSHQAEVALQEFQRWTREQEQGYLNLEKVLFGELRWKDIVDQRSTATASAYQHFLTASVKDRFDLTHKEYWHLRGRIKSFARLRTLRTPGFETLDALNPALFEDPDASLKDAVIGKLTTIVEFGRSVLCTVADAVHAYKMDLTSDHQSRSAEIVMRINQIQQLIAAGETKFGQRFFDESTLSNTWHALIKNTRPDIQILHQARHEVREAFVDLIEMMRNTESARLEDMVSVLPDPLTMEGVRTTCQEINDALDTWTREVDAHASEHHKRLNALNISRSEELRQLLRAAEERIEEFIAILSREQILKSVPEVNALSIEKKAAVIEATVRLCLRLLDAAPDIDAYTLWTGFWTAQNNRTRAVLRCLDLMEDADLVQAFDTWYFGLTLGQIPDHSVVHDRMPALSEHPQITDLRAALEGHMRAATQTTRHEMLRETRSVHKALLASIAKGQLNTFTEELRILPAKDISQVFPVLLCTPEQVAEYGYYADRLFVISDTGHDYKMFSAQAKHCVMVSRQTPKVTPEGWTMTRLDTVMPERAMDWRDVPTSDRLPWVESMTRQFTPFLDELRVYNARGVQVFSFLGDRMDNALMQRLGMPYKQVGEHGLTNQLLVECFLDRRKPIIVLLRDQKLGQDFKGYLPWHLMTIQHLKSCGVEIANLWSVDLKNASTQAMDRMYETVRRFAEESNAVYAPGPRETSILERDAQTGPLANEQRTEDAQHRGPHPGL